MEKIKIFTSGNRIRKFVFLISFLLLLVLVNSVFASQIEQAGENLPNLQLVPGTITSGEIQQSDATSGKNLNILSVNPYPQSPSTSLSPLAPNDWPQVQKNSQRTGFTSETIGTSFTILWRHAFQPEKVYPQVQPIVAGSKVFVGTESGNLYAFQVDNGVQSWKFTVGAPIMNSVATDGVSVFFGAMDGAVYAINASNGSQVWRTKLSRRTGFSTAPVIADGKVMLGGRDGVFYALNPVTGGVIWQYTVGAPILQTAAADGGRVFFGAMDMRVYALTTATGNLAWKSNPIPGKAFKDYWPVVYGGRVFIRPVPSNINAGIMPGFPFNWFSLGTQYTWLAQYGPQIAQGNLANVSDAMNAQNTAINSYNANPAAYTRSLFILNEQTGSEDFVVPHWPYQTMNGATTPPCVDVNGNLIVPVMFIRSGWGRLSLTTQRMIDILYDGRDYAGNPFTSQGNPAGMGNADENMNVTCTGNQVLAMHTQEGNANYTGVFNLALRRWFRISAGAINKQMSTNTQGGGGNPASVSNGRIFHISYYELIVRSSQP